MQENRLVNNEFYIEDFDSDYSKILQFFNLQYKREEYWYEIGEILRIHGWILYIPVTLDDIKPLLLDLIPYLCQHNLSFKIPIDADIHHLLKEGHNGIEYLGKIISIYVADQSIITDICRDIIHYTSKFRGTIMLSAIHLGGLVYTRYGCFEAITTPSGELIYNDQDQLVKADYSVPYIIPNWVKWPFDEDSQKNNSKIKKLLNGKYYLHNVIRDQPKGRVMHAVYRKGFWRLKNCLIKEGRYNMFTDEDTRDICDRLKWQKYLHQELSGRLRIPSYVDFFEEDGNCYLVIDFIKGMKLEVFVDAVFLLRSWSELSPSERKRILNVFIEIVNNVNAFHKSGFVHRDLTISNFMINKKDELFLIDLELAYSSLLGEPSPPFQVGTQGYMSPEQEEAVVSPSTEQDVYSIGAILLTIVTRLSPKKFLLLNPDKLKAALLFFTRNLELSELICACLDKDPAVRPDLKTILSSLTTKNFCEIDSALEPSIKIENIRVLVQKAIYGLQHQSMLNASKYWISQVNPTQEVRYILTDFYKGITGIIFNISVARRSGYDINSLQWLIDHNFEFLIENFLSFGTKLPTGLYHGSYGVAMAIAAAMDAGVLPHSDENSEFLVNCLFNQPQGFNIESGLAGYGIALLYCSKYLSKDFFENRISFVINDLLATQQENGAWKDEVNNSTEFIGFENGVAGATWFLLEYSRVTGDEKIREFAIKSLNWLSKKTHKIGQHIVWPVHSNTREGSLYFNGTVGVARTFLKGYELTGNLVYKDIFEKAINTIPFHLVSNDLSFSSGLTGLGGLYLEAFSILGENKYYERAKWIVDIFATVNVECDDLAFWIHNQGRLPSPDLMEGNSGIIYYLVQFLNFKDVKFLIS